MERTPSVERLDDASPSRRLDGKSSLITKDRLQKWLLETADPPDTPGAFLHLGKTGGSTLSTLLRNGCHSHVPKPCHEIPESEESYLSQLSTYYHMPDFPKLANRTTYAFYTLTLRDPLDRTLSSLIYTHPGNQEHLGNNIRYRHRQFFTPCFPDLDEFAAALHKYNPNITPQKNDKCSRSSYRSLHNQVKWVEHLYYDAKYMTNNAMAPNRTILVIRMEHLADDWISANEFLGQANVVRPAQFLRQHDRRTLSVQDVSATSRQYLCAALAEEYTAYLRLIWQAVNLNTHDRHDAYARALEQCPSLELASERELDQWANHRSSDP